MLPSFFIHLRRHVQAGGTVLCRVGQRPHRWRGPAAAASVLPSSAWKRKSEWIKENSSAYCKYWEGKGAFSNIMYIGVKIEKLYLESALHGLSWKGKAYVIYLRNWTISSIACGELECITVGFKVSSLFCYRLLKSSSMISFWSFPWRWVPWLCDEKWRCSCSLAWAAPGCRRPSVVVRAESSSHFTSPMTLHLPGLNITYSLLHFSLSSSPLSPRLLSWPAHLCHCVTFLTLVSHLICCNCEVNWIVSHLSFKFL